MANAICRASGCNDEVTRGQFTRYCAKHHRALYRHGHTHGNALSKRELSFYRKLVKDLKKNCGLFTRENYVCYDGLPYDYEAVRNAV